MLHDVVNRGEDSGVTVLDDQRALQIAFAESGENRIRLVQHGLEVFQQRRRVRPVSLQEFSGTVTRDRASTNGTQDPFAHVAREMTEEIADAVRRLVWTCPHCRTRQNLDTATDFYWVLFRQPVPRPSNEILGDRHLRRPGLSERESVLEDIERELDFPERRRHLYALHVRPYALEHLTRDGNSFGDAVFL